MFRTVIYVFSAFENNHLNIHETFMTDYYSSNNNVLFASDLKIVYYNNY